MLSPYRNGSRSFTLALGGTFSAYRSTYVDPATGDEFVVSDGVTNVSVPDRFDFNAIGLFLDAPMLFWPTAALKLALYLVRNDHPAPGGRVLATIRIGIGLALPPLVLATGATPPAVALIGAILLTLALPSRSYQHLECRASPPGWLSLGMCCESSSRTTSNSSDSAVEGSGTAPASS